LIILVRMCDAQCNLDPNRNLEFIDPRILNENFFFTRHPGLDKMQTGSSEFRIPRNQVKFGLVTFSLRTLVGVRAFSLRTLVGVRAFSLRTLVGVRGWFSFTIALSGLGFCILVDFTTK